jgi:hypothetical protein
VVQEVARSWSLSISTVQWPGATEMRTKLELKNKKMHMGDLTGLNESR